MFEDAPKKSGAYKLAKAWGERDLHKIAKAAVPGYAPLSRYAKDVRKEIRARYDKPFSTAADKLKKASR